MKIRQGFVSNSSSSSFIVRTPIGEKEDSFRARGLYTPEELMTQEDLKTVLKYGFQPTPYHTPSQQESNNWELMDVPVPPPSIKELPPDVENLGYRVSCNEDTVIEFLVQNNIPFSGSTHYGHRSVFFWRGSKTLLWMQNLGVEFEMYGHGSGVMKNFPLAQNKKVKPVHLEPVSNYSKKKR